MNRILPKSVRTLGTAVLSFALAMKSWGLAFTPNKEEPIEPAVSKTPQSDIGQQRYHYELAKSAIKKKDWSAFDQYYSLLGNYPLIPYLDYALIKRDIKNLPFKRVDIFLAANKGTFLETRTREQILFELARQKKWSTYQDYFSDHISRKELQCFNLYARTQTGDEAALSEVADIWVHPKSLPKSCDRLFSLWRQKGGLTPDVAWERFDRSMQARNYSLARYISTLMSGEYKTYADKYLEVHRNPALIKNAKLFKEHNTRNQQIIAHGAKRLARKSPINALYHWERYEAQQLFPNHLTRDTKLYIAKRLTWDGHFEEAEKVVEQSSELRQTEMIERLIRESLKTQQWAKVIQWMDNLDEDAKQSDRWLYWRARAREELLGEYAATPSKSIYEKLSKNRSFYGFLSADKLGIPYSLVNKSVDVLPSTRLLVENNASIERAKELWLLGNYAEAQAEWLFGTAGMSPHELMAAGELAAEWGWHNKGIMAMISGKHWDHLDVRFPLAYQNEINKASAETQVEVPLIYAIARQESAFKEHARSHAGAMGLMQLMPSTAKQTARKNGVRMQKSDLYKPELNLHLGGHYLNELLDRFNGNRILAAAAYNAGPHRVDRWMNDKEQVAFDVWIETIPFKETRGYVQNVLAFSVIYSHKLGKKSQFITELEATRLL